MQQVWVVERRNKAGDDWVMDSIYDNEEAAQTFRDTLAAKGAVVQVMPMLVYSKPYF